MGKLALLGQKGNTLLPMFHLLNCPLCCGTDVVIPVLVAGLEDRTRGGDPLWERIAQALFRHIPDNSLEAVLDAVMAYATP